MSDTTLPTLRSPPSEAEPLSADFPFSNSSESDAYPFLVHSQQSIINGEPPEADNGKLARQKRKRTSPEDQATLEAEYKRNPKPDKAARIDILKRVSLGEKEVQIWFQNRRQNTRRKTRPLLPHEIAAFGLGGIATLSSAPVLSIAHGDAGGTAGPLSACGSNMRSGNQERCPSSDESQNSQRVPASPALHEARQQASDISASSEKLPKTMPDPQLKINVQSSLPHDGSRSLLSSEHLPVSLGYLSNRRNARASSLSVPASSAMPIFTGSSNSSYHCPSSSCPERISAAENSRPSSSQVRISLSLDGKAELVSSQVSPPRPQRPQASSSSSTISQARPGLKRCQSDVPSGHDPRKSSLQVSLPRISSGRSRDARTWEFCCDTEARDELTTQAENESSGSAVAAISLLRSTSTSNPKSNGSKRNAPAPKTKSVVLGKKPKLSRASSSLARLQGSDKPVTGSPSGDSDKENWLPLDSSGNSQRRSLALPRPQKQKRRRVLEESKSGITHASKLGDHKTIQARPISTELDIFGDPMSKQKVDREVDRFMRGEVSPSKKGDLDCIQGLLSLSQGTWQ